MLEFQAINTFFMGNHLHCISTFQFSTFIEHSLLEILHKCVELVHTAQSVLFKLLPLLITINNNNILTLFFLFINLLESYELTIHKDKRLT